MLLEPSFSYRVGGVVLPVVPLGDADGGHGVPGVGLMPELLPVVLPGFVELEVDPGVDVPLVVPGRGPQGPFVGDAPGVLLGFVVEGVLPGVGVVVLGVVVLGVVVFGVELGEVEPDVDV